MGGNATLVALVGEMGDLPLPVGDALRCLGTYILPLALTRRIADGRFWPFWLNPEPEPDAEAARLASSASDSLST